MDKSQVEELAKCSFDKDYAFDYLKSKNLLTLPHLGCKKPIINPEIHRAFGIFLHISRIHGLPQDLQDNLIRILQSENESIPIETQTILAQCIRHAVYTSQPNQLYWEPLIEIIRRSSSMMIPSSQQTAKSRLLSELVLVACSFPANNVSIAQCKQLQFLNLQDLNSTAAAAIKELFSIHELTFTTQPVSQSTREDIMCSGGTVQNEELRDKVKVKVSQFFKVPSSSTTTNLSSSSSSSGRASAVKAQQISTERTHEAHSEAEILAALNLSKALNSRNKASSQSPVISSVSLEPEQNKDGSDQSWYRNTWYEIVFLNTSASNGGAISHDDQEYLFGKLWGNHCTTESREDINRKIINSFFHISKRQKIKKSHYEQILELVKSGDLQYNNIRFHYWVVKMAENCIARDPSYFTTAVQDILNNLQTSTSDSDIKDVIYDIFRSQSNDSQGYVTMFKVALKVAQNQTEKVEKRKNRLDYIRVQALNKERAGDKVLFNRKSIGSLLSILAEQSFDMELRKLAGETIENYMDHDFKQKETEFAPDDLTNLSYSLAEILQDSPLQACILRIILKQLMSIRENPQQQINANIWSCLIQAVMRTNDLSLRATVLTGLQILSETFTIPNVSELAPLLVMKDSVSEKDLKFCDTPEEPGSSSIGHEDEEEPKVALSSMVIKIFLNDKSPNNFLDGNNEEKYATLRFVIEAIDASSDKQTRIMCSEYLYAVAATAASKKFQLPLVSFLHTMLPLLQDPVSDVRAYCTLAFVKAAASESKRTSEIPLESDVFERLLNCYIHEKINFSKIPDYTEIINEAVLVCINAECTKSSSCFKSNVFSLLELLMETKEDVIINIIGFYCKSHPQHLIPESILELLEPFLLSNLSSSKEIIRSIFEDSILKGQKVPSGVIQCLIDELIGFSIGQQEEYRNCFCTLISASCNQEFGKSQFTRVILELWNVRQEKIVSHSELFKKLHYFLQKGNKLSQEGFRIMTTEIKSQNTDLENILVSLLLAAQNGQNIPEEVTEALSSSLIKIWGQNKTDFLKLTEAMLCNNQSIPNEFKSFLENTLSGGINDTSDIIPVILLDIKIQNNMSENTLKILCEMFLYDSSNQQILSGLISASHRTSQFTSETLNLLCNCLVKALQLKDTQTQAIQGIVNLDMSEEFQLNDNHINTILELMTTNCVNRPEHIDVLRKTIANKELSPSQKRIETFLCVTEIQDDLEFISTLEKFITNDNKTFKFKLSNAIIRRLIAISCNEEFLIKIILVTLKTKNDFQSEEIMALMENIATRLLSTDNQEVQLNCHEFLVEMVNYCIAGNILISRKLLGTLESNLNSAIISILIHVTDKYELSLESKFEIKLMNLDRSKTEESTDIILKEISLLIASGVQIQNSSIQRIIKSKSKSKKFVEILGRLMTSSYNQLNMKKDLSDLILHQFSKNPNELLPEYIYTAMKNILKHNSELYNEEQLQVLENALVDNLICKEGPPETAENVKIKILECCYNLLKLYSAGKHPTDNMVSSLSEYFVHRNPSFRLPAYQCLAELHSKGLDVPVFKDLQESIALKVTSVVEKADVECSGDLEDELLVALMDLETWDFTIFQQSERSNWKRDLTLSNITASFVTNPLEKLEFLGLVKTFEEKIHHDPLLSCHALMTTMKMLRGGKCPLAAFRFIESLKVIANHDPQKLKDLLNSPDIQTNISVVENLSLEFILSDKCLLSSFHQKWLVKEMHQKVGYNISKQILDSLKEVTSFEILERIIKLSQDLRQDLNLNLLPNSKTPYELTKQLEILAFTTLLHKSGMNNTSKRIGKLFIKLSQTNRLQYEFLKRFIQLDIVVTVRRRRTKELETILEMLLNYKVGSDIVGEILNALETLEEKGKSWVTAASEIILSSRSLVSTLKTPAEVVKELKLNLKKATDIANSFEISSTQLEVDIIKIGHGNFVSQFQKLKNLGTISSWKGQEIKKWAELLRISFQNRTLWMTYELSIEALAVSKRAFYLCSNFHLTNVQIISLLLGLNKGLQGQLQQVATGAGKSTIVAVLASINAIRCGSADIFTSSPVLAERDAKSWAKFYSLFGLSCSHNGDVGKGNYTRGLKQCYTAHIVYGETSMFQFDYLRHYYSNLGTLGTRKNDFAIVDEADSMLVDDLSKLARLSSLLPGMDLIQVLYHVAWQRLSFIESKLFSFGPDQIYFIQGKISYNENYQPYLEFCSNSETGEISKIEDLVAFILEGKDLETAGIIPIDNLHGFVTDHLTNFLKAFTGLGLVDNKPPEGFEISEETRVKIPRNLKFWVETQIPKWVDSCMTAKSYQETVHYLVEDGQVKPVDYNTTGIVQDSTSWSGGLHQFLQIKHGLKMSSETVTTNFISNMAMFQKYSKFYRVLGGLEGPSEFKNKAMEKITFNECNIVGLTGTLGSSHTRKMLRDLYNVNCVNLPQAHYIQYVQYNDNLVQNRDEWLSEIIHATESETLRDRGVLIICETIRDALEVADALKSSLKNIRTKLYTKNNAGQEDQIERIQPGEVFIATNLAGRGTDIKTDDIEKHGGLHVILAFSAMNIRVEEQAFGRTARQGRLGSGQLICISGEISGQDLRKVRETMQKDQLNEFLAQELPLLKAKDNCFRGFCSFLSKTRKFLRESHSDDSYWSKFQRFFGANQENLPPSTLELNVIQAIEERWAMFLGIQLEGRRIPITEAWGYYKFFELRITLDLKKGKVIRSPFYHICIGNDFMLKDGKCFNYVEKAMSAFDDAIKIDSDFATGAHAGQGFCYLRGVRNLIKSDQHKDNCRTKAIACFNAALSQVQQELANIASSQNLVQGESGMNTNLLEQLSMKQNALNLYSNTLDKALGVAKASLRGVHIAGTIKRSNCDSQEQFVPHMSKGFDYTDDTVSSSKKVVLELAKTFDTFCFEFNDLKLTHDSGEKDQAKKTIDNCKQHCSSVDIKFKESTSGLDDLLQMINSDKYGYDLPKAAALQMFNSWESNLSIVEKTKNKTGMGSSYIDIEVNGNKTQVYYDLTFKEAKKKLDGLQDTDVINLRYKSGNSDTYKKMKDVNINLQMVELKKQAALKALNLLTSNGESAATVVSLNITSSLMEEVMKKLSALAEFKSNQVTLLKCNPGDAFSGWTSVVVPMTEGHLHKNNYENGEVIFKTLTICDAKTIIEGACSDKDMISLAMHQINRKHGLFSSAKLLKENKTIFSKTKITFTDVQKINYGEIISCLRNTLAHMQFSVVLKDLSTSSALMALEKADMGMGPVQESKQTLLSDNFSNAWLPVTELWEFQLRGIYILCEFNEKSPVPWFSIGCVVGLAAVQLAIGAILIYTGFGASVGMGLITEGAADLLTAYRAYSTRQFSWSSYGAQKAVSLVIAAVSAGMGKLKDAAKGVKSIAENVAREAGERALTTVLAEGGKTAAIEVTKRNLKSLVVKQVGVAVGEAVAREALNNLVSMGSQVIMSNYKSEVLQSVESKVKGQFLTNKELRKYVRLFWAFDSLAQSTSLDTKIKDAVRETLHPQSGNFTTLWNSVGLPLLQGVLSSSQQVGGIASMSFRVAGMINGMKEMIFAIEKVLETIIQKLKGETPTEIMLILVHRLKVAPKEAHCMDVSVELTQIEDNKQEIFHFTPRESPQKVSEYFSKLNSTQKEFEVEKLNTLLKWISDTLSEHILKVADSQLRAPVTTFLTSKAVSQVSNFIQSNYIVSFKHNTEELKDKKGVTVAQQINAQAKNYMIEYQQLSISRHIADAKDDPKAQDVSAEVKEKILKTLDGAPAGINEMSTLAKLQGMQLVILTDSNSLSKGENDSGDQIVVLYTPGTKETHGVGHFDLVDSSTGQIIPIENTNMDCGYEIFSYLNPGSSPAEMRLKVASFMAAHPKTVDSVINDEAWIQQRFPEDANKYLLVGGVDQRRSLRRGLTGADDAGSSAEMSFEDTDENQPERQLTTSEIEAEVKKKIRETRKYEAVGKDGKPFEFELTTKCKSFYSPGPKREKNESIDALSDLRVGVDELGEAETGIKYNARWMHIDNSKLGGSKEQDNLAIGSASMNSLHSKVVEEPLKRALGSMDENDGQIRVTTTIVYPKSNDKRLRVLESLEIKITAKTPKGQAALLQEYEEINKKKERVSIIDVNENGRKDIVIKLVQAPSAKKAEAILSSDTTGFASSSASDFPTDTTLSSDNDFPTDTTLSSDNDFHNDTTLSSYSEFHNDTTLSSDSGIPNNTNVEE